MPRLIALVLFAALGLTALPVRAQTASPALPQADDQMFSVSDVQVDVTAVNAMQAREKGFDNAQSLAFRKLMDRLVAAGQPRMREPSTREVQAMVRDVIIESEKASAVRYIASFTVRFKPEPIRALLEGTGVSYVESRRPPLVVVPVLSGSEAPLLWEDPNPWREAWARRPTDGLVPFVVPSGELEDATALSVRQAMAKDSGALANLARRYGALDALVVVASVTTGPDTLPLVTVQSTGVGPAAPRIGTIRVAAKAGEALPAVLGRAADAVAEAVITAHKRMAAVPPGQEAGPINAIILISNMKEWLQARQRLSALPLIAGIDVLSLSRNEASVVIRASGTMPQVEQVLTQAGFLVTPAEGHLEIRPSFGGASR